MNLQKKQTFILLRQLNSVTLEKLNSIAYMMDAYITYKTNKT